MNTLEKPTLTSFFAALAGVWLLWLPVLALHLVAALFAALITYSATRFFAGRLRRIAPYLRHAELLALLLFVVLLGLCIWTLAAWLDSKADGYTFGALLAHTAAVLDQLHAKLPPNIAHYIPLSADGLREALSQGLKSHGAALQTAGAHTVRGFGHALAGVVIGGFMAVQLPAAAPAEARPIAAALYRNFENLTDSFNHVFFAQARIALINTALTAVYLFGILPLMGKPLPMSGMLLAVTFFAGLIPVVGNLISNFFIVILSLSDSLATTALSLAWLIAIHKLEYFLNAHIIGHKIKAAAWELLIAMLTMEALFGLAGLVSAPIIYAQIKHVLAGKGWI
ncbi:MAG: hypothetical protein Q4G28_04135 [Neisseria sp.]|nr:hypothetical protein [Neisseria sp.]